MTAHSTSATDHVSDLFGNYKAEWLGERIFELFRQPAYFPDLQRPRPCVLVGGRGTGKTTVLRSLSYEGRFALDSDWSHIPDWPYYGLYYRINTNRVTAFQGPELPAARWHKLFGHYMNLVLCQQAVKFLTWYQSACPAQPGMKPSLCLDVSRSLNVVESSSLDSLRLAIQTGLIAFEATLNNIRSEQTVALSLQGAPLDLLFAGLKEMPQFASKSFFFLLDEYENLLNDQQVALNGLIKHASDHYTFKIGVRELGWRRRHTLSDAEELTSPADYVKVDIAERLGPSEFREFARLVCDARLTSLFNTTDASVTGLFPQATHDEEARELGGEAAAAAVRQRFAIASDLRLVRESEDLSDLELLLVDRRSRQRDCSLEQVLRERRSDPDVWQAFVENYRHAVLFQIASPKAPIRKLYTGWGTFTGLAASNIRYLLELVDHAFREHRRIGGGEAAPFSWTTQTIAAQTVGRKNLFELEGFREGALLVRLTIGLGRLFQIMARDADNHAPEQNQFSLQISADVPDEVRDLISSAVMHSALIRTVSNKHDKNDPRSYDYSLHPIFSAFFGISHRRKRKIIVEPADLLALVADPRRGLAALLARQGRPASAEPLPEQLLLFGELLGDTF